MELHFMERLWNYLKLTFLYMAKRGLVKRGKLLSKTILNLISHHHHLKPKRCKLYPNIPLQLQDYEFSCSNSPDYLMAVRSRIKSGLLSCFRNNVDHNHREYCFSRSTTRVYEPTKFIVSPYVITAPDCGSDDDEDGLGFENDVDYRAEKFIQSFYEELRAQSLGNNFILYGVEEYSH